MNTINNGIVILFILFIISLIVNIFIGNYLYSKYRNDMKFTFLDNILPSVYPFHISMYLFEKENPQKSLLTLFFKSIFLFNILSGFIIIVILSGELFSLVSKIIFFLFINYTPYIFANIVIMIITGIIYKYIFFRLSLYYQKNLNHAMIDKFIPFYRFNVYCYLYIKDNPLKRKKMLLIRLNIIVLYLSFFINTILFVIKFIIN